MEFKDKLKAARKERNLSQQALADAIYVSRSAVAKWENGLGLPSPESMEALEGYFGVEPGFFCTDQPETVILRKNRRIRADALLPGLLALVFLIFIFPYTKTGMKLTVLLWEKPLTAYAQEKLLEPYSEPDRFLGFRAVTYPKAEAVFFHFDTGGYVGFFYSESGEPVGFQGTEAEFFSYGRNNWLWHEETGDNWMQCQRIIGNWYWYDMNF